MWIILCHSRSSLAYSPSFSSTIDQTLPCLAFLALSTLSSLYPILLLPLLILLLLHPPSPASQKIDPSPPPPSTSQALKLAATYVAMLASLILGERAWLGGWEGVFKGAKVILTISDLTPNVGLSWYFFTEMFDHFRTFFTGVFQVRLLPLLLSFPAPLQKLTRPSFGARDRCT